MAEKLKLGDSFPAMTFNPAGGGSAAVPADLGDGYKIILFYRVIGDLTAVGSWPTLKQTRRRSAISAFR